MLQEEAESKAAAERAARDAPVPAAARLLVLLLGVLYVLYAFRIQSVRGPGGPLRGLRSLTLWRMAHACTRLRSGLRAAPPGTKI